MSSRRGDVWLVDLNPTVGAEIRKTRPAMLVNSDAVAQIALRWRSSFRFRDAFPSAPLLAIA